MRKSAVLWLSGIAGLFGLFLMSVQPAEARPAEGREWKSPASGMEFVWIDSLGMWVGKYEVTNNEYRQFKPGHDSKDFMGHDLNGERQPVVFVNFDDALDYADWLTERDSARLGGNLRYRLPTSKEWEAFAQCGDGREYPWGNQWPPRSGNAGNFHGVEGAGDWGRVPGYDDGFSVTCAVEQSWRNSWGLYGVGGNVWEATTSDRDSMMFKCWRGGAWSSYHQNQLRTTFRLALHGGRNRGNSFGFRLVLAPAPVMEQPASVLPIEPEKGMPVEQEKGSPAPEEDVYQK